MSARPKTLLTRGNPKILKGTKRGYITFILHLAPASVSGYNVCAMATDGCKLACLNTAGRGGIPNSKAVTVIARHGEVTVPNVIQAARIAKTVWFFQDRASFMAQLVKEIAAGIAYAERQGLIPVFRLNGTSDIRWEAVEVDGHANIMEMFPTVQFYDYTKLVNRKALPANYRLTFSLAENNDMAAWASGLNVAAVFKGKLPATFMGRSVIDGDETDLRFLDPVGVVVGLKAKGKAKRDTTGFVRAA
jgi:hypothetical protein